MAIEQYGMGGWLVAGPPVPVVGAILSLDGVGDGPWVARWMDTRSGAEVRRETVIPTGGRLVLAAPEFGADVALRLELSDPL